MIDPREAARPRENRRVKYIARMTASETSRLSEPRALLVDLYRAAVRAAAPGPALTQALDARGAPERPVHILALGKAAGPMAEAAVALLRRHDLEPAGGVVIAPEPLAAPHPALTVAAGDHPEPGPRSLAAAEALARAAAGVGEEDEAWVLLSGGATSLAAAPVPGVPPEDLKSLYAVLLASGLDIAAMNRARKRFSRWGAGRLARALAPARVRVYAVSDVIGDDPASIGSGPCVPDETTAAEVRALLTSAALWSRTPESIRKTIAAVEAGREKETPKPGDPIFAKVETRIVASNRSALAAAAARARALGLHATVMDEPLQGEAAEMGRRIALTLLHNSQARGAQRRGAAGAFCTLWGGETTVTLGDGPVGKGGRCQELALAAAEVLAGWKGPGRVALLAAGTDGRDGPTDAAGAIVDETTWEAIRRLGREPEKDLSGHSAYDALGVADALFQPGLTSTNVADLVAAVRSK